MEKLYRMDEVTQLTGLGKRTIYKLMAADRFPKPVKLTSKTVGWRDGDLTRWLDDRPRAKV